MFVKVSFILSPQLVKSLNGCISFHIHLINVDHTSFAPFENHTKGIGMKLSTHMGYDGRDLGFNGQGIINPIKVKERPRYEELCYVHEEIRGRSKIFEVKK